MLMYPYEKAKEFLQTQLFFVIDPKKGQANSFLKPEPQKYWLMHIYNKEAQELH